jgi:hypothetical protein
MANITPVFETIDKEKNAIINYLFWMTLKFLKNQIPFFYHSIPIFDFSC